MLICSRCGKSVAVLASTATPEGPIQFDMCERCFAEVWNEIFDADDTDEDFDDW